LTDGLNPFAVPFESLKVRSVQVTEVLEAIIVVISNHDGTYFTVA
jgi:hypothetical protein